MPVGRIKTTWILNDQLIHYDQNPLGVGSGQSWECEGRLVGVLLEGLRILANPATDLRPFTLSHEECDFHKDFWP